MNLKDLNPEDIQDDNNDTETVLNLSDVNESDIEDGMDESEPSQSESLGRGAFQNATFDFGDEIVGGVKAAGKTASDLVTTGKVGNIKELYRKYQEQQEFRNKLAEETNPTSYFAGGVAGGIAPALLTGGAGAAAKIGTILTKEGAKRALPQAMKEAAKYGAGYGAVSGLGSSEADIVGGTPESIAQAGIDTASGATLGAATGALTPIAVKGATSVLKQIGKIPQAIANRMTGDQLADAAYEFGKQGKKIEEKVVREDLKDTASELLNNIDKAKDETDLNVVRQRLDSLGYKVDTKEAFDQAVKDLKKIESDSYFNKYNKEIIPTIEKMASPSTEEEIAQMMGKDISNMNLSQVENLRSELNKILRKADDETDPIIQAARKFMVKLTDITDSALPENEAKDYISKRAKVSDILSSEHVLGIDERFHNRSDINRFYKVNKLASKLGFKKGFGIEEEGDKAVELLGKDTFTPELKNQMELLKKVNVLLGRETQSTTTKAGLMRQVGSELPNIAGRTVNQASKLVDKAANTTVGKVANNISRLSQESAEKYRDQMVNSNIPAFKAFGSQLDIALKSEGAVKNALIWSLSQQPAFREAMRQMTVGTEEELSKVNDEVLGTEVNPESENEDLFSSLTKKFETTSNIGYVPKNSSKSGVTIASGLDLANFNIDNLEISDELKNKLKPYTGVRGQEAAKIAKGLQLTENEVSEIDSAMAKHNTSKISPLTQDVPEEYLTQDFQEGLDSLYTNSPSAAKALLARLKAGKVDEAIDKGVEWNKTGGRFASGLLTRRMEELHRMFPDRKDLIEAEGKKEYDKYASQTKKSWDEVNTLDEKIRVVEDNIDRTNQLQSAGDSTPIDQLDALLGSIKDLGADPEKMKELEDKAVAMQTYSDGDALKKLLQTLKD